MRRDSVDGDGCESKKASITEVNPISRYQKAVGAYLATTYEACILDQPNIFVTVTRVNAIVDDFLTNIKSANPNSSLIVGFDMKLIHFKKMSFIATINFCIGKRILIYHLPDLPFKVLHPFFSDQTNIFVGERVETKLQMLNRVYGVGGNARCVDLAERAAEKYSRPELRDHFLNGLSKTVLGKGVLWPPVDDLWHRDILFVEQVLYASIDAFVAHELGQSLLGSTPPELKEEEIHADN